MHWAVFFLINLGVILAQPVDHPTVTQLCNFENKSPDVPEAADGTHCVCDVVKLPPMGQEAMSINCSFHHVQDSLFSDGILPQSTDQLDLSHNELTVVPHLVSSDLHNLMLDHNLIKAVQDKAFANVTSVLELNLSGNAIELITSDAFFGLSMLQKLDLSHNKIKSIQLNAFSVAIHLEELALSGNPLGNFFSVRENDLFLQLGVTTRLGTLAVEHCNLTKINLASGVGLEKIFLGFNRFQELQSLPKQIFHLDLSGTPMPKLTAKFLPHLSHLEILTLRDMPDLHTVDEYAFYGLPKLANISFQGSSKLLNIHPYIFGRNVVQNETDTELRQLTLRDTDVRTLNASLEFAFEKLEQLDLTGAPLRCDCQVQWLKQLNVTVLGSCLIPTNLRGQQFADVDVKQLTCDAKTSWVYILFNVILALVLVALLALCVWVLCRVIRPRHQVRSGRVGTSSPYARVTIEPNQMEHL